MGLFSFSSTPSSRIASISCRRSPSASGTRDPRPQHPPRLRVPLQKSSPGSRARQDHGPPTDPSDRSPRWRHGREGCWLPPFLGPSATPDRVKMWLPVRSPVHSSRCEISSSLSATAMGCGHPMLVARKALQRPDIHRASPLHLAAGLLAGGGADPAADGDQGIRLPGDEEGLLVIPFADGSHVSLGIGCQGAGALACHQGLVVLDPQDFT